MAENPSDTVGALRRAFLAGDLAALNEAFMVAVRDAVARDARLDRRVTEVYVECWKDLVREYQVAGKEWRSWNG